jgi:hypothetical protein
VDRKFSSFAEFYPYYLSQHRDPVCRSLHVAGVLLAAAAALLIALGGSWRELWLVPVLGYGLGWVGHFVFEGNRPASFRHPFYSLLGDLVMTLDTLRKARARRRGRRG